MNKITIDYSKKLGPIKPMHGVNNGPVTCNFWYDATEWFQAAHIPFSRLHDTEYPYGSGEFVDISCIFKDFDADVNDPNSYNFTLTDEYLNCIRRAGTDIIYRLGTSIEHQPIKLHIIPPENYKKWAEICEHVILHYNEGWADGHHMNIQYWEIWNEPDIDFGEPRTWAGTQLEFFEFYRVVATHLKRRFPNLKIGGPAIAMPTKSFPEAFLTYLTSFEPRIPLDFYSWHGYLDSVETAVRHATHCDELLKRFGYHTTESICDEWNYVESWAHISESYRLIHKIKGACVCAGVICSLQRSPLDKAMYYDAQLEAVEDWCGLFSPKKQRTYTTGNPVKPLKTFYTLLAFDRLYQLGTEVHLEYDVPNLYGCAATNGEQSAMMLVNCSADNPQARTLQFHWDIPKIDKMDLYLLDELHDLSHMATTSSPVESLTIDPDSVLLLTIHHK